MINTDEYGQAIITETYNNPEKLARAIALHEGFTYSPDESMFWKQSKGSEKSYLYVTPDFVSRELVEAIHGMMNKDEYLIIACRNYDSGIKVPNITIKKIPQAILGRCEFGKSDYNLNVTTENYTDEDFEDITDETPAVYTGDRQLSINFDEDN